MILLREYPCSQKNPNSIMARVDTPYLQRFMMSTLVLRQSARAVQATVWCTCRSIEEVLMKASRYRQVARDMAIAFSVFLAVAWGQPWRLLAQGPATAPGLRYSQISESDMREWLGYLASDELQGRQVFTEGYGRASQYVADLLKSWGVKPIGANGSYFQPVKLKGYRVTRNSTVTIEAGGQSRTFKHGDHVTFGTGSGGKQTLRFDGVEFLGYGLPADYLGRELKGKLIVTI